jgi:membrane-bound serine protease (ClpP class)
VGTVQVGERRLSALTAGEFIDKDRPVRVVKVEGSRIVVREIPGGEA